MFGALDRRIKGFSRPENIVVNLCYNNVFSNIKGTNMPTLAQQFGGEHTDEKLKILKLYLDYFTTVLKTKPTPDNLFRLVYVDPFCGPGWSRSSDSDLLRDGSPMIALRTDNRPFDEFIFNDVELENIEELKRRVDEHHPGRVASYYGGSADVFLDDVCPTLGKFRNPNVRGVIFIDPFATQVSWGSIEAIAKTQTLDMLLLFPRSALTRSSPNRLKRGEENRFKATQQRVFGDESWSRLYDDGFIRWFEANREPDAPKNLELFDVGELAPNLYYDFRAHASAISYLYRERLKTVFPGVSDTYAVLRSNGSPLFEVHFAVSNPSRNAQTLAQKGANYILKNYKNVQIKD